MLTNNYILHTEDIELKKETCRKIISLVALISGPYKGHTVTSRLKGQLKSNKPVEFEVCFELKKCEVRKRRFGRTIGVDINE